MVEHGTENPCVGSSNLLLNKRKLKKMTNLINTLKNNQQILKSIVYVKKKKKYLKILNILWDENLISGYKILSQNKSFIIKIFLKYKKKIPAIKHFKTLSKSGKHFFLKSSQIWKINENNSIIILSTTQGLLSLNHCKKKNIGGEPFFCLY